MAQTSKELVLFLWQDLREGLLLDERGIWCFVSHGTLFGKSFCFGRAIVHTMVEGSLLSWSYVPRVNKTGKTFSYVLSVSWGDVETSASFVVPKIGAYVFKHIFHFIYPSG